MATENKEKAKGEAIFPLTQEQINQIAAIGAKEGVRAYKEEQKKEERRRKKEDSKVRKTKKLLSSYRRIKATLSDGEQFTPEEQAELRWKFVEDLMGNTREIAKINRQVVARGVRAVNAMRNAELEVLKGQRSGRTYRKPHSKATYTASAPGEPPARRTGNLRMHWNGQVKSEGSTAGGGVQIIAELESQEKYAGYLENGTKKMAARPFVDKIKEKATPEIEKIYKEPYG